LIGSRGYCKLYDVACRIFRPARELYFRVVEKTMGYNRSREAEAAESASKVGDYDAVCNFLSWAFDRLAGSRVCIVGPLYDGGRGELAACDIVMGVEQVYLSSVGCDVVSGDMDVTHGHVLERGVLEHFRIVHVHGDNYTRVVNEARRHGRNVVFTSQAYCFWPVLGIGGFTDGDRLVLLAMGFKAREIRLLGFDFRAPRCVGKAYCDQESKSIKLELSRKLLVEYARIYGYEIIEEVVEPNVYLITLSRRIK